MNIFILSAVIMILLTTDTHADEQTNSNNMITTYDPGEGSSESSNFSRLHSSDEITAHNQGDHISENQGHKRFEDPSPKRPIKFENDTKDQGYVDIDKANPRSLLADITFDHKEGFDQNDRISNARYEGESNNSENKIKFEDSYDGHENSNDQEGDEEEDYSQSDSSQVVFEDDGKADENDSDYSDESETEADITDKPIKNEDQDKDSNTNNRDSERNPVTERVVFKDDSNINQQLVQIKERNQRRFKGKQTNYVPAAPNSLYPSGIGYPGYLGVSFPDAGYPGPVDPNTGYSGYPTPGYPISGYLYPNYPSPYPGMAFPTPAYPGYSPYPSKYPPTNPGYGTYPTQGYQGPGDRRPPVNPTAYPSSGQSDPNGHPDTRYPGEEYAGSPSPVAAPSSVLQSGQSGSSYPGPEYPYYSYPVPGYPPPYPADPNLQYPPQNQVQYRPPVYPGLQQPGNPAGPQRPSRRPKSLTQRAVSAVTEALTSIALYDDQQCVPRILCEMAGGSTASSPALVKASASLQPLLSLLQAYNGVSSSPLFIFGRAAVTGMTAKGKPSACYRAYPKCPTDPEKLINYLNNHNGGFFRFFGQPETPQHPHNLEQFYNYLSGQNGLPGQNGSPGQNNLPSQNSLSQQSQQQNYGYPRLYGYGFLPQNHYAHPYNYGHSNYNEQIGYRNAKDIDSEIEGRIQNKPGVNFLEAESDSIPNESQETGSKWSFPEDNTKNGNERDKVKTTKKPKRRRQPEGQQKQVKPTRGSKTLKFPDDRSDDRQEIQKIRDYPRKEKRIFFPGQNNFQVTTNYQTTTPVNPEEYYFDHKHNFYVKRPKALKTDDVVYVVRGNGDPNHPDVVRVRPGESI